MINYAWLKSVYSDGSAYYVSNPKPVRGETITIRLSVRTNPDLRAVILRCREYGAEVLREMAARPGDNGLTYYAAEVRVSERLLRYQFYLITGNGIFYYTQHRLTDYMPDETRDFRIPVDYGTPDWTKTAVFYQIFPDRFRRGRPELSIQDGAYRYRGHPVKAVAAWQTPAATYEEAHCLDFYGGDLYGVIDALDALQALGVNALYLNPIFWAASAHRYDALDFDLVCPHLGGNEALAALTDALHARGMHLMLDISVNHVSSDAKWFNRDNVFYPAEVGAYGNPAAAERHYFFFTPDNGYHRWAGVETMPTLNYGSEPLRDRIYRAPDAILKKWLLPPYRVDAWRFDVADVMARSEHADLYKEVWSEISGELKRVKPDVFLLAEDWTDCSPMLDGSGWDSVMNYFGFTRPVREFLGEDDLFNSRNAVLAAHRPTLTAAELKARIEQFYSLVPGVIAAQFLNHLDTHDTTRLHNNPAVSRSALAGAITLMFTVPGMPCIYYGDEVLLDGRHTDVDGARYPMDWTAPGALPEEARRQRERYRLLAQLRRTSDTLINGGFRIVQAVGRLLVSARFTPSELLLTVFSADPATRLAGVDLADFGFNADVGVEELFGQDVAYVIRNGILSVTVPPEQSFLLRLRRAAP